MKHKQFMKTSETQNETKLLRFLLTFSNVPFIMGASERKTMKIEIDEQEYEDLKLSANFLYCLRACGVENWRGFLDAVEMYNEECENED